MAADKSGAMDDPSFIVDRLTEVSIALSAEKDYHRLLELILRKAIQLARCDAGSLYIVVPGGEEAGTPPRLRFAAAQNDSVAFRFQATEMPLTQESLAGYVALTGVTLTIEDAYAIPDGAPYRINRDFDRETGYRTKSLLVLPMTNHRGEVTGVLQLINCKRNPSAPLTDPGTVEAQVVPFNPATRRLMQAVGSLAAVSIDNQQLYANIERLFEGFVKASVTAIEQRDPTTSGHSLRVSVLTTGLAEHADRAEGPLAAISFTREQMRELRYAALLHDFGKVGVREHVLVKARKLYPHELERIMTRLETARLCHERDALRRKLACSLEGGPDRDERLMRIDGEMERALADIDAFQNTILRADEPTVLPDGDFATLRAISAVGFTDRFGNRTPFLDQAEATVLSIPKGSLSEMERLEIESHVTHTYEFLQQIPWTPELKAVPAIAYGHHEKLDGRGYPRGVKGNDIPVQSRIMTVADIYDALTACDRPYKKAVPQEKALDILMAEAKDGMLDADLVDLFIECKVFGLTGDLVGRR
jgi:HD-GYP domain-containing protein (c-di-GMP phosphodiesterase class II)